MIKKLGILSALKISLLVILLSTRPVYPQSFLEENGFIYTYLIDLLKNPHHFMRGFQYEMDNLNPVYGKKYLPIEWRHLIDRKTDDIFINSWRYRFSLSMNVSSLIFSLVNYSFKITAFREDIYIPEIYFGFGHYLYVPVYTSFLNEPYAEMLQNTSVHSFSGFVGMAKSLRKDVKVYGGYRFAYGFMKMDLPSDLPNYISLIRSQDVDEKWMLHDMFVGVSYLIPDSNWETLILIEFNPQFLFFSSKLEFLYKYVGIGLGYYANNTALPFRPFIRVQYEF